VPLAASLLIDRERPNPDNGWQESAVGWMRPICKNNKKPGVINADAVNH
jgi:hypothetical protein